MTTPNDAAIATKIEPQQRGARESKKPARRDLYKLLEDHHSDHEDLETLWQQIWMVPEWVDWDQLARGQDVFYRYGGAALTGLTFQSLLGGMGAQKVVETLARTGGFSPKVARHRLFETTQHILQCTKSLEAIQPGGEGFASTIRVRLLHCAVRQRILKLCETRPDYYNVPEWGIPVNDLDSVGTIGTFSATLIWLSLPRQGIYLRQQEIEDYIALWRYIAYLIGAPDEWLETPVRAKAIMDCLLLYEISPSDLSRVLANNVIVCLADQPPAYPSANMLIASAWWLNGPKLSASLGLPKPPLHYTALVAGQCLFFMFFAYAYRLFPFLDKRKIAFMRRVIWKNIVEHKKGLGGVHSLFEFKYVPQYGTITDKGAAIKMSGMAYTEWRNLQALLIAGGVFGVLLASSMKILSLFVGR